MFQFLMLNCCGTYSLVSHQSFTSACDPSSGSTTYSYSHEGVVPAGDYQVMLRQQGYVQSRETFSSLFTGLSCLQNLKLLDLRKIARLEGSFWQPLAQLQSLETLYVIIDNLRRENIEAVSSLSKLLHHCLQT